MAGRLAIDFGTSNTRAALWDEGIGQARTLAIPDVSQVARYRDGSGAEVEAPCVPSLIHYAGSQVWIGRQVRDQERLEAPATFRWMKRYISNRLELPRQVDGLSIKFSEAGDGPGGGARPGLRPLGRRALPAARGPRDHQPFLGQREAFVST